LKRSIIAGDFMKNPSTSTIYPPQCFSCDINTILFFCNIMCDNVSVK
jgi:hypothetical protein